MNTFWFPQVPDCIPLRKTRNSTLRIACIVSHNLLRGLQFEAEILLLTPNNWKYVLNYAKPDLLLVESCMRSATWNWQIDLDSGPTNLDLLFSVTRKAKDLSVPTVFWLTRNYEPQGILDSFVKQFDLVCCANPADTNLFRQIGISSKTLLPCIQPAWHNPFRHHNCRKDPEINLLFDGWADIDCMPDSLKILRNLRSFGLNIIESRSELFSNTQESSLEYKDNVLGCVNRSGKLSALKYAKTYLTLDASLSSMIRQQWMSLEAAACRVPVVHYGLLDANDVRNDFVIQAPSEMDLLVELIRYREDDLYRERIAHLGWRTVNLKHTFAHRIQSICQHFGISHDWIEFPKASIIMPTYRKTFLPRCLSTYEHIDYPNKELIIVYNGDKLPNHRDLGISEPRPDILITYVPSEMFAGAALNMGHLHATGKYFFRVDDDDFYGRNYILDMILHAKAVDADLFGKPPAPIIFEDKEEIYIRKDPLSLSITPQTVLQQGQVWLGGNSISGSSDFLNSNSYPDASYGASDTSFIIGLPLDDKAVFAFMDRFNLVAGRRNDISSHTWKTDQENAKKGRIMLANILEMML